MPHPEVSLVFTVRTWLSHFPSPGLLVSKCLKWEVGLDVGYKPEPWEPKNKLCLASYFVLSWKWLSLSGLSPFFQSSYIRPTFLNELSGIRKHCSLRSRIRHCLNLRPYECTFLSPSLFFSLPQQSHLKNTVPGMFLVQRLGGLVAHLCYGGKSSTWHWLSEVSQCSFLLPCDLKMLICICFWKGDRWNLF